jgi:hypothetical protein
MNFQKIVLTIATVLLIIILVVIGLSLSKSSREENWPPIIGECPDYWVDMSGNGQECFNSHSLGRCNLPSDLANQTNVNEHKTTMNFNQSPFTGDNGNCAKYRWAKACGVTWDGITSGVKPPCDTSTTP